MGGEGASSGEETKPEPDCNVLMRKCGEEMEAVRLESNLPQIWQLEKNRRLLQGESGVRRRACVNPDGKEPAQRTALRCKRVLR